MGKLTNKVLHKYADGELAPKQAEQANAQELTHYVLQRLIQQDDRGSFVWLADQSAGVARKTPVRTGLVGPNGLVAVTGGLNVSSRIITSNNGELRDGDRIRVIREEGNDVR